MPFGLTWSQVGALVANAPQIAAAMKDFAAVANKHKDTIQAVRDIFDTGEDEPAKPVPVSERDAKISREVVHLLERATQNVDNN